MGVIANAVKQSGGEVREGRWDCHVRQGRTRNDMGNSSEVVEEETLTFWGLRCGARLV
jgi:hypothetical protein